MLTLTPVVCILSGIAFSGILEIYLKEEDTEKTHRTNDDESVQTYSTNKNLYDKVCLLFYYYCIKNNLQFFSGWKASKNETRTRQ